MKRMIVGLLAICLLGSLTVLAEENKEGASPDMTVTGKLTKDVKAGFSIIEADGAVTMIKVMAKKASKEGEAAVVDLDKWVGKEVKLVGKGITRTKAGKTVKTIKTVTSVEEAAAPAAAAPAAEAPVAK
jgi:hypothetical protein